MVNALRRLAAFCLSMALCLGLLTPAASHADSVRSTDDAVVRRQAAAFMEAKSRLPELARLVNEDNWTFTRNLIHGPMQEVGREMLYINQSMERSDRKQADKLAKSLKSALADLDEAARSQDPLRMQKAYISVAAGFGAYSNLIPEEALN